MPMSIESSRTSIFEKLVEFFIPDEAVIFPQDIPLERDGYWYHATFGRHLKPIRKSGLVVGDGRNWREHNLRQSSVGRVWFAASPGQAHAFANQRQQKVVKLIAMPELAWVDWIHGKYFGPSFSDRLLSFLESPVRRILARIQPRFEMALLGGALWTGGICILRVRAETITGKETVRQNDDHYETIAIRSNLGPSELEVWNGKIESWLSMESF